MSSMVFIETVILNNYYPLKTLIAKYLIIKVVCSYSVPQMAVES